MEKKRVEEVFKKELDSFEATTSGYRDFAVAVICKLPAYFMKPSAEGGDNGIISHTKASIAFANVLFSLEEYRKKFGVSERDSIRTALLLHDGMFYGADDNGQKQSPDHPELMATLLESEAWEAMLPDFLRSDVVSAVRNHSGRKTVNGITVDGSDIDRFVHMCVLLATRRETTVQLPGTEEYYRRSFAKPTALDIDTAASIVRQITGGCRWDGQVYAEGETRFVILDNNRVCVADELREAFLVVGQARAASMQNPGYLQAGQEPQQPAVLDWNAFLAQYPDWNTVIYGKPGKLFVVSNGQNVPISDAQAVALGIKI